MIKKVFCAIALALCVVSASAQDDKQNVLVVYGGPQFSMASVGGGYSSGSKFSYLGGLQYERNGVFGEDFGLYGGLEYTAKGVNGVEFVGSSREDDYGLNFLQLNLGVKYAKEIWGIEGFGEIGPYVAYGIGGSSSINGHDLDGNSFESLSVSGGSIYTDGGAGFSKFDAGFKVAIGAEFSGFRVMAGYQQGLIDIADSDLISNGYKNYGFFAAIGYGFKF